MVAVSKLRIKYIPCSLGEYDHVLEGDQPLILDIIITARVTLMTSSYINIDIQGKSELELIQLGKACCLKELTDCERVVMELDRHSCLIQKFLPQSNQPCITITIRNNNNNSALQKKYLSLLEINCG